MPRTPIGDLIAALVLFGAIALLVYVAIHDGSIGLIDRHRHPVAFWLSLTMAGCLTAVIAVTTAWEAVVILLGG